MEDSTFSFNLQETSGSTAPSMQFEPLREGPAKIKVIGVGGGGGNAVNHMYRQGIHGVEFIVCNTDAKALESSPVPNKIVLGTLGAGNVPERARQLALAHKDEIRQAISDDTQMLFITAGMGGGTGTGAAPIIAEIAKNIELEDEMVKRILVVAIVTEPFSFEGRKRREQAEAGIEELKKYVDAILVINNDKLRKFGNVPLKQAFSQADDVLLTAAKGIAEIITVSAYVNIDFRDVNTVMENSGTALMGAGEGHGEDRARQAIEAATTSVLLNDNDISGAQNILLYFSCSPEHQITMDELGEVTDYLTDLTGNNGANVIWGIGDDESLNDELRITLIATGFQQKPGPVIHELPTESITPDPEPKNDGPVDVVNPESQEKPQDVHEAPIDESGIHMVHKAQSMESVAQPSQIVEKNVVATPVAAAVAASATNVIEESQKVSPVDDPFASVKVSQVDGKRHITLDMPMVEEPAETVTTPVPTQAATQQMHSEPISQRQDLFDQIRVIKRDTEPVVAKPEPVVFEEPVAVRPEPVAARPETVAVKLDPVVLDEPESRIEQTPSYADQQITRVFTPQTDEQKIMARAERIRKMNELLRNDPDGPRKIEEMTTEQLSGEPIFHTSHSSESDAARTIIGASGTMTSGMSFLDNLPD